ncbi:PrcB C-terminal [Mesonia phycicola]|uniref:PrcB C-terminal n=1 Tax=Mesonia phycicola TaxID=579105 RepID=A0A1M6CRY8_9FLAO|nr:protease complex subunit PrcB family protein [Mesonia phycicola]SHI63792.1 PrcB C-terminal [Mesonia phycicola]
MKNLVYICLAIVMFSCNSAKNNENITINLISKGDLYGDGAEGIEEQQTVIDNQQDWNALFEKININEKSAATSFISIDFNKQMLLAIFDKQRTTGGHAISIVESVEAKNKVTFKYKITHPDGLATMVMTQPFYLATIAKTEKEIVFEEVK